jgi:ribosomal 50S subunit-associated protein YjgA (DUF615 family)
MPWVNRQWFQQIATSLQRLDSNVSKLLNEERKMSQATDNLAAAVQRETTIQTSAIALIQGIADQLRQVSTDPQVQALADQLNQNTDALARSVADNTPAAPQSGSAAPQS